MANTDAPEVLAQRLLDMAKDFRDEANRQILIAAAQALLRLRQSLSTSDGMPMGVLPAPSRASLPRPPLEVWCKRRPAE